jgi:hypothetical protein
MKRAIPYPPLPQKKAPQPPGGVFAFVRSRRGPRPNPPQNGSPLVPTPRFIASAATRLIGGSQDQLPADARRRGLTRGTQVPAGPDWFHEIIQPRKSAFNCDILSNMDTTRALEMAIAVVAFATGFWAGFYIRARQSVRRRHAARTSLGKEPRPFIFLEPHTLETKTNLDRNND